MKHAPLGFWAEFNGSMPGLKLGELLDGNAGAIAQTWEEGRFTAMFDFPLAFAISDVFCRGESPAKLAAALSNDRRYPDPSMLVTLVDNHDLPRLMSACGGDVSKVEQALAFMFAMRGVPSIIWGTEAGFAGDKEPANRASMRFEPHPLKDFIAQWMKRRAETPALSEGAALPVEVDSQHVVIARVAPDGTTVHVRVENGQVSVVPAPDSSLSLLTQWRTGAKKKTRVFQGPGFLTGSGPELGDWDREKALPLPVTLELPVFGAFEFKRIVNGEYEPGANHVLFVAP